MNTNTLPDSHHRERAMQHFHALSHEDQANAIRRLAAAGMTDHGITSATKLAVEQVRRILGEVNAPGRASA